MAVINLQKGNKIELSKSVSIFRVGLAWDASAVPGKEFDLDALAIELNADGKLADDKHIVFYNNLTDPEGAVKHSGDNKTGEGAGDDETITIDTTKVLPEVAAIVVMMNIHDGIARGQNFGQVKNAKASVYENAEGTTAHAKYDLEEDASMSTQVRFVKIYRHNGGWKCEATGEQSQKTLNAALAEFGIESQPNI